MLRINITGRERPLIISFLRTVIEREIVDTKATKEAKRLAKAEGRKPAPVMVKIKQIQTVCQIHEELYTTERILLTAAEAVQDSRDQFIKARGRKQSLRQALSQLNGLTKAERAEIWAAYLNPPPREPKAKVSVTTQEAEAKV
jgi:hypothetical protein